MMVLTKCAGGLMEPLLVARGLTKCFGSFVAVDAIDLTVNRGEVLVLLGPNGAGKTTTIGMLTGLLRPSSGTVHIAGLDIRHDARAVKRLIGYLPDEPNLYDKLTARESIYLMARLYGTTDNVAQRASDLMQYFGLLEMADSLVGSCSHGTKQKIALCGLLIHNPTVLLLDEPMLGLDPHSVRLFKETIRALADQGKALIVCSHLLSIAQTICDRLAILRHGRVLFQGSLDELRVSAHASESESLEDIFLRLTEEPPSTLPNQP
jgi:ABC-2 type transport system ATP-binding protein